MFLQKIVAGFNEALYNLTSALKMHFADYCNLDVPIDDTVILARDGSLLTVFRVDGVSSVVPADTFIDIVNYLSQLLTPTFSRKGLIIQSVFSNDPSQQTIEAALSKITEVSRQTIRKMQYREDAESILKGQEECLLDIVAIEKNFLCVWTTSACLSPQESKEVAEQYKEKMKNAPNLGNGANPFLQNKLMVDNHAKNVEAVRLALLKSGVIVNVMHVAEAIHEMKMGILVSPERDVNVVGNQLHFVNQSIINSNVNISLKERQISRDRLKYDGSLPRLNEFAQIEVEPAGNNNQVLIDGVYFQPTLMERAPTNIMFFNNLFYDLHQARSHGIRIPYRILFTLASDGESLLNFKYHLATVLRKTNIDTRAIYEGAQQIKGFSEEQGVTVKFNCHMLTWGRTSEEASQRSSIFNTRMESWGSPRLNIKTGNPIEGFASASMGFSKLGIAQMGAAPLDRALCLLPLARPTSLWKSSPIIFRSLDGKPIPYVSMADEFTYWVTFVAATPGSGKSVLANWLNTAFYLSGNLDTLPYVSIIDFGFSSRGFINILKRFLPAHQEHYATYKRVENNKSYCVNPHQLGLGLRFPKANELDFMVNLYCLALEDSATGQAMGGEREVIDMMLRACYEIYSDCYENFSTAEPKPYNKGVVHEIDKILDQHKSEFQIFDEQIINTMRQQDVSENRIPGNYRKTTWWEVVDFLMQAEPIDKSYGSNYIKMANIAQRYASFTMNDMLLIINKTDIIKAKYKDREFNGRPFLEEVTDRIANFARKFEIFSDVTQFDIEEARAVSFDMEAIVNTKASSNADFQSNALFYMYAMRVLTQKFFLIKDDLETDFPLPKNIVAPKTMNPEFVYHYHYKNVTEIARSKKRIMVDEFHYTGSSEQLMKTFEGFMRVVRKRNMELLLISQVLSDFVYKGAATGGRSEIDLLTFATTVFILSPQTGANANFIAEKLNITDKGTMNALANEIKMPKESPLTGGSLFMWLKLGKYQYTHIVTNKLSNLCLWNFDTTTINMSLRDAMIRTTMNETEALDILARSFAPHRTKDYVENMRNELRNMGDTVTDPYDKLAQHLYRVDLQRKNYSR